MATREELMNGTMHDQHGHGTGGYSKDAPLITTASFGSALVAMLAAATAAATIGGPFLGIIKLLE